MRLNFAMVTHNAAPDLWSALHRLRQAVHPGDRVVLLDAGSQDETPLVIRRFDDEIGWGADVDVDRILSDPLPGAAADWMTLAQTRLGEGWTLRLGPGALPCPAGIAMLRDRLSGAPESPDLVVLNMAHRLTGTGVAAPGPDQDRWPDAASGDPAAARLEAARLVPLPERLLLAPELRSRAGLGPQHHDGSEADQAYFDTALANARSILFCDRAPILYAPPDLDWGARAATALGDLGRAPDTGPALIRAADRIADAMRMLPPEAGPAFLSRLEQSLRALPRGLRGKACAAGPPAGTLLATLRKGGAAAALPLLLLAQAHRNREREDALLTEIAQLRQLVDLALPGPDALLEMYRRARQP